MMNSPSGRAVLRSGEAVSAAVSMAVGCGAEAILFNCSRIEVMTSAVCEAQETLQSLTRPVAIGVYANAFDPRMRSMVLMKDSVKCVRIPARRATLRLPESG